MKIISFPKPLGSPCPLCKKWTKHDQEALYPDKSWDWHECIERPKRIGKNNSKSLKIVKTTE